MQKKTAALLLMISCLSAGLAFLSCDSAPSPPAKTTLQKISLASPQGSLLGYTIYVGREKGFFKEEGVDLTIIDTYSHGKATIEAVIRGETDLAVTAEIPFMFAVLTDARISAFARTLSATRHFAVVARKDKEISQPGDLQGKTVGVVSGTGSEYFWDLFQMLNNLPATAVNRVNIDPQRMVQALQQGEVDAIAVWNPIYSQALEALGENGITFYPDIGSAMFLIAARQNFITNNPEIIENILHGLERSAQFIRTRRPEADRLVAKAIGVEEPLLEKLSADYRFEILLDQSLLQTLEDSARWAIDKNLTAATAVPNFLANVYTAALDRVKPEANAIYTTPPRKIRIAEGHQPIVAPVLIAQKKGYFKNTGLEVELQRYGSGKACLKAMFTGAAELATAGDIPIMYAIMADHNIRIVATIEQTKKNNAIVARADAGISTPHDLQGKKIGVTMGTGAEFFLDSFLLFHEVARDPARIVHLPPREMVGALLSGKVDAVSTWNPHVSNLRDKLNDNGRIFYGEDIYTATQNLVGLSSFVSTNPEAVKKIIGALDQAVEFIRNNPVEARNIVTEELQMDIRQLEAVWGIYTFDLRLDQTLLMTLRDEARWATTNRLVEKTAIPAFANFIYQEALKEIRPLAVTIGP